MGRGAQSQLLVAMLWFLIHGNAGSVLAQSSTIGNKATPEEQTLLLAVERQPDDARAVGSLGEYYLHEENWREAGRWLARAYKLTGGNESIGYDLALARMQAGDLEGAKKQAEQMLETAESAKLHNLLGAIEDKRGRYLEAANEYHRAAEIDPSESNIFDLATFLLQHKKFAGFVEGSIKFFRYGVAQFPHSSQMMVGLGVALYASEQYDEAVRVLCAAVDLDPNDSRPIEFLGKARQVSPELGIEVDRRLQNFAVRYPHNAAISYYYAFSLWQRGGGEEGKNLDKIQALLIEAENRAPGWYEPHYQLGVVYESVKRYAEAIREMQKTVRIEPDFAPAHFRLAVLYGRTGDKAKAAAESAIVERIKNQDRKDDTGQAEAKK